MNNEQFWKLMELVDQDELADGYDEEALEPLIEALAVLHRPALEQFEERLAEALFALDRKDLAACAGEAGDSADGFLYARCGVVARGKACWDEVLGDPTRMPQSTEQWCEPLLYAVALAWEAEHDEDWDYVAQTSYETGSNEAQW